MCCKVLSKKGEKRRNCENPVDQSAVGKKAKRYCADHWKDNKKADKNRKYEKWSTQKESVPSLQVIDAIEHMVYKSTRNK